MVDHHGVGAVVGRVSGGSGSVLDRTCDADDERSGAATRRCEGDLGRAPPFGVRERVVFAGVAVRDESVDAVVEQAPDQRSQAVLIDRPCVGREGRHGDAEDAGIPVVAGGVHGNLRWR